MRRIFIAINLPEKIQERLYSYSSQWPELPCRWTKKENLHITLFFLGYLKDEHLPKLSKSLKKALKEKEPFFLNLKDIVYAPPDKKTPRMIWARVKENESLKEIWQATQNSLKEEFPFLRGGERFSPHITLARFKQWEFRRLSPQERPKIEESLSLSFEVRAIEIMESKLRPKGPDYFVLESVKLGEGL